MKRRLIDETPTVTRMNLTPIIDVALVLVIILLITAPILVATDVEVDLPQANTREVEDEVRVSVTLGKSGEIAIDDDHVTPHALTSELRARLAEKKNKNVLVIVRADAGAPYKTVKKVLKDVRAAGAKRLAIATRQKGKARL